MGVCLQVSFSVMCFVTRLLGQRLGHFAQQCGEPLVRSILAGDALLGCRAPNEPPGASLGQIETKSLITGPGLTPLGLDDDPKYPVARDWTTEFATLPPGAGRGARGAARRRAWG